MAKGWKHIHRVKPVINYIIEQVKKVKISYYSPVGPRVFWEAKASRFCEIGT
jgi:hypothetical protein